MNAITSRPRRRTAKEYGPDPIDVAVGRRVRLARDLAHMTQVCVASRLGFSFQLVQKYEQGEIRISASRLFQLARLLRKPVDFFFAATGTEPSTAPDMLGQREMELIQTYRAIANPEVRERLARLVKGMSERPPAAVPKSGPSSSRQPK